MLPSDPQERQDGPYLGNSLWCSCGHHRREHDGSNHSTGPGCVFCECKRSCDDFEQPAPAPIERPACAAIRYGDVILAGKRHHDCLAIAANLGLPREAINGRNQGFMTTLGRFVDREEGWKLAIAAGIVIDRPGIQILFSEDLY